MAIQTERNKDVKNNKKFEDYKIAIIVWFGSQKYLLPSTKSLASLQKLIPQFLRKN